MQSSGSDEQVRRPGLGDRQAFIMHVGFPAFVFSFAVLSSLAYGERLLAILCAAAAAVSAWLTTRVHVTKSQNRLTVRNLYRKSVLERNRLEFRQFQPRRGFPCIEVRAPGRRPIRIQASFASTPASIESWMSWLSSSS